jgi:hypothetical protein
MTERITARQFHEADGVDDWRVVGEGTSTYFRTGSFAAGARLLDAIKELAGLDRDGSVTHTILAWRPRCRSFSSFWSCSS